MLTRIRLRRAPNAAPSAKDSELKRLPVGAVGSLEGLDVGSGEAGATVPSVGGAETAMPGEGRSETLGGLLGTGFEMKLGCGVGAKHMEASSQQSLQPSHVASQKQPSGDSPPQNPAQPTCSDRFRVGVSLGIIEVATEVGPRLADGPGLGVLLQRRSGHVSKKSPQQSPKDVQSQSQKQMPSGESPQNPAQLPNGVGPGLGLGLGEMVQPGRSGHASETSAQQSPKVSQQLSQKQPVIDEPPHDPAHVGEHCLASQSVTHWHSSPSRMAFSGEAQASSSLQYSPPLAVQPAQSKLYCAKTSQSKQS